MLSCAQQGAPQGGPPDVTPPVVDATMPASGDVLVNRSTGLTIQFSEPIDKNTFAAGLQISPSRTGKPSIEWSNGSRRVDVTWPDSLRDSVSYRVTLATRIADRRGNKLAEPFTFAFSTGMQVDRGEIRGLVHLPTGSTETFDVFAYRTETMPDTFWLSLPDYNTQTGTGGRFQLPFLRSGRYRVLVLADGNRNRKLDAGEQFALAPRDFDVADDAPADSFSWFPTVYDTVPLTLRSCATLSSGIIALSFSHPLDTATANMWMFDVSDSATGTPVEFVRLNPTARRPSVVSLLGDWIPGVVYSVSAGNLVDQRGQRMDDDSCYLSHLQTIDSTAPRIESVSLPTSAAAITASDPILWVFSEPIDLARFADAGAVRDSSGNAIPGTWSWTDPRTLTFTPEMPWNDTLTIIASLDSARIIDRPANVATVGPFLWTFAPLGMARMGVVEVLVETGQENTGDIWLESRSVTDTRLVRTHISSPGLTSISLPAGRWQLGGFIDADRDGRWFPGHIAPFEPSELRVVHSDTLDVRARFTLEDITLKL